MRLEWRLVERQPGDTERVDDLAERPKGQVGKAVQGDGVHCGLCRFGDEGRRWKK